MEKVITIFDWWDGPLCGLASHKGSICIYERIFDEIRDEWSDEYYLTPIEEADVNTLLRDWNRWRDTVQNERPLDSYYSLEDKADYLRIIELSEQKRAYKKVTVFHGRYDKGYIPIEYYVEWRE